MGVRICTLVVAIALFCTARSVSAVGQTTEQMVRFCEGTSTPNPEVGEAFCAGFMGGMLGMHTIMTSDVGGGRRLLCLPDGGISNFQAKEIFLKWARDHPEDLHRDARVSVAVALMWAFACRQEP